MQKMLTVIQNNRVLYDYVLADSWFSSADNMKFIKKDLHKEFVFALKSNRLAALSFEDKLEGKFVPIVHYHSTKTLSFRFISKSWIFLSLWLNKSSQTKMTLREFSI